MTQARHTRLVLASRSPRRQALLRAGGIAFEVRISDVDESKLMGGPPRAVALKTALAKADAVAGDFPQGTLIVAADTMVVYGGRIFNKPADRQEARAMLRTLSGQTHTVVTSLALARVGGETLLDAVEAGVLFNPLADELVESYVDSGEADDKAGAYGIQGLGARLVAAVEGDLTCVIGLPLARLREMAQQMLGEDLFAGHSLRQVALKAFPDLTILPPACLAGIPD